MVRKAEYELSEVGTSLETKVYDRKKSIKNLCKVEYYLLFVFTLFLSIISIIIFIGCSNLKKNYVLGKNEITNSIRNAEDLINNLPTNLSTWINQQSSQIVQISNDIVVNGILKPVDFINTTTNQFVDNLNIILGGAIPSVNLNISIANVNIPQIYFEPWNLEIPVIEWIQIFDAMVDIPYYFGVTCLCISVLFICVCFGSGLGLFFDYRSKFQFVCRISFWIGLIFGIISFLIMFSLIYVHFLYTINVSQNIINVQGYIHGNLTLYNNFIDENELLVSKFISDNLNFMVNVSNKLIQELQIGLENNINRILSTNIKLDFVFIDLVNINISFDDLKIPIDLINIVWIDEKIKSVFIGMIIISAIFAILFTIMVIIVCVEKRK